MPFFKFDYVVCSVVRSVVKDDVYKLSEGEEGAARGRRRVRDGGQGRNGDARGHAERQEGDQGREPGRGPVCAYPFVLPVLGSF